MKAHPSDQRHNMRPSERFNLHPATHGVESLRTTEFDVICIGSGWAGRMVATQVIKAGYTALIIEKELFGGRQRSPLQRVGLLGTS